MGSQAYGLATDESDIDRRGIYLAPVELQWSLFGAPEQFEDDAAQAVYWELQKLLIMAKWLPLPLVPRFQHRRTLTCRSRASHAPIVRAQTRDSLEIPP